ATVAEQADDVTITVTVSVKNTSSRDGDEVVQLYVRDNVSSVVGPVKQLKAFERVTLKAGEQKTVTLVLHADDLKLLNPDQRWLVEKGDFSLMIGASSDDIRATKDVTVSRTIAVKP
ncbi:MAG: beta-glucosidase, partial [Cytophagaceae bacterium]